MKILNTRLMSHPLNWLTLAVMVFITLFILDCIFRLAKSKLTTVPVES